MEIHHSVAVQSFHLIAQFIIKIFRFTTKTAFFVAIHPISVD